MTDKPNATNHRWSSQAKTGSSFTAALVLLVFSAQLQSGSVIDSRHDLSTGSSPEVCVFCHTPHQANMDVAPPLWNRSINTDHFTMYSSNSLNSIPSPRPSSVSLLCLGCHDGTISYIDVNGVVVSTKHDLVNYHGSPDVSSYPNCERCHGEMYTGTPSNLSLGTDLGNDHPISMVYPNETVDPEFNTPPDAQDGWGAESVKLVQGKVECCTCHNVHDPDIVPFLRISNNNSELCLTCHIK